MSNEWNTSAGGGRSNFQYLYQENFFNKVPRPEFNIDNLPTRTLSTFWNMDVLPTAERIRKIYVRRFNEGDTTLSNAWKWINFEENRLLVVNTSLMPQREPENIPTEVILNWQTSTFFTLADDFKKNIGSDNFEPFVAFKPDTIDFDNDIRRLTFDPVDNLRQRPLELHKFKVGQGGFLNNLPWMAKRVEDKKLVEYFETVDSITWTVLFKYYSELRRREKRLLSLI